MPSKISERSPKATYLGTRYITDGTRCGVVRITGPDSIYVVNVPRNERYKIPASRARRMTHAEIEAYNELPNPGDPTQEEIAERSRAIRSGWTDSVRRQREIFHLPAPLKELFA